MRYANEITVAVVSCGVIDVPQMIVGVIVPDHKMSVAPEEPIPTEKYVAVEIPPVPIGKVINAAGCVLALAEESQPVERAVEART